MTNTTTSLIAPKGIRFSCSECANCCLQWPVPITKEDFKRIAGYSDELTKDKQSLFRVLDVKDDKLQVFSHSLEKNDDGSCEFLLENNQCQLHEKFGFDAKPSMCQLFPYTFTGTPDGVFCSVSFASSAVLFNQGDLLESNLELLEKQFKVFQSLFPNLNLDWSTAQVIDGVELKWQKYKELEKPILEELESEERRSYRLERKLLDLAESFRAMVPSNINLDNLAGFEARPKFIDQVLLKHLIKFYCPTSVFETTEFDFQARKVIEEVLTSVEKVDIEFNGVMVPFGKIISTSLGELDERCLDMLRRFIYLRVHSKLYFGPGFNFLSLISGFNHLLVLAMLARLCLKLDVITGELQKSDLKGEKGLLKMAEHLRTMERKLTVTNFSDETVAMLEVLLASPKRIERFVTLCA